MKLQQACLGHDREAWDAFVDRFSRLIFASIHDVVGRRSRNVGAADVDDLFAATFLALYRKDYRKLRQWDGRCSLASWVRLVTVTTVTDALRKKRAEPRSDVLELHDRTAEAPATPEELIQTAERAARVRRALALLGGGDRELLLILYREDLDAADAARRLGIHVGALYTRKNRALKRLKEHWESLEA